MGNKALKASPSKGNIKAPGYLASVLPFLEPGDGVPELEAYLRTNPDQQLTVAQELANQSVDAQFRRNVVTLGALRILRLLMISHEHNVVLCAIHALGNLAVDSVNHDEMVRDGCFYNIVDLLSSGKVDLQCKAARAITNLTVTFDNKYHFDQLGAIGALVKLAQNLDENCRAEAVAALGNLAVEDDLEIKICQQGGIDVVHVCLGKGSHVLQEHAARAIQNLTCSEQNRLYYEKLKTTKQATEEQNEQNEQKEKARGSDISDSSAKSNHSKDLSRDIAASVGNWFDSGINLNSDNGDSSSDDDDDNDYDDRSQQQQPVITRGGTDISSSSNTDTATIIAAASPPPVAPVAPTSHGSEWRQLMDPNTQRPYWYNVQTQESSWSPPSLLAPRPPAASTPTPVAPPPLSFVPATHTSPASALYSSSPLIVNVPPPISSPPPSKSNATLLPNLSVEQALSALPPAMASPKGSVLRRGHGRAGTIVDVPNNANNANNANLRSRATTVAPPTHDYPAPPAVHVARPPSVQHPAVPPPRVPDGLPPNKTTPTAPTTSTTSIAAAVSPTRTQLPARPQLPTEPHPVDQLSGVSKQVALAINLVRTRPIEFAKRIRFIRSKIGSDDILRFDWGSIQTTEGTLAYDEALSFLSHMRPMSPLEISTPMCRANQGHATDLGSSGATGHEGSDGSKAAQRLRGSGGVITGGGKVSEGIEFGPWMDGTDFVVSLVVGDGEASRTHRKILLDPTSGACGVAVTKHKLFGFVCVVTLAPNCALASGKAHHSRKNTMQLAQTMSLPTIRETVNDQEGGADNVHVRRGTVQMAANLPLE